MGANALFLAITNQHTYTQTSAHFLAALRRAAKKPRTNCTLRAHPLILRPTCVHGVPGAPAKHVQRGGHRLLPPGPGGACTAPYKNSAHWVGNRMLCGSERQRRSAPPGALDQCCQPWSTNLKGAPPPPHRGQAVRRGPGQPLRTARLWNGMSGEQCAVRLLQLGVAATIEPALTLEPALAT